MWWWFRRRRRRWWQRCGKQTAQAPSQKQVSGLKIFEMGYVVLYYTWWQWRQRRSRRRLRGRWW
jgi:hypothetical protein